MTVSEIKQGLTYRGGTLGVERTVARNEHGVVWVYCPATQDASAAYAMPVEWFARWAKESL